MKPAAPPPTAESEAQNPSPSFRKKISSFEARLAKLFQEPYLGIDDQLDMDYLTIKPYRTNQVQPTPTLATTLLTDQLLTGAVDAIGTDFTANKLDSDKVLADAGSDNINESPLPTASPLTSTSESMQTSVLITPEVADVTPSPKKPQPIIADATASLNKPQPIIEDVTASPKKPQLIIVDVTPSPKKPQPIFVDVTPSLNKPQPIIADVTDSPKKPQPISVDGTASLNKPQPIIVDVTASLTEATPIAALEPTYEETTDTPVAKPSSSSSTTEINAADLVVEKPQTTAPHFKKTAIDPNFASDDKLVPSSFQISSKISPTPSYVPKFHTLPKPSGKYAVNFPDAGKEPTTPKTRQYFDWRKYMLPYFPVHKPKSRGASLGSKRSAAKVDGFGTTLSSIYKEEMTKLTPPGLISKSRQDSKETNDYPTYRSADWKKNVQDFLHSLIRRGQTY